MNALLYALKKWWYKLQAEITDQELQEMQSKAKARQPFIVQCMSENERAREACKEKRGTFTSQSKI